MRSPREALGNGSDGFGGGSTRKVRNQCPITGRSNLPQPMKSRNLLSVIQPIEQQAYWVLRVISQKKKQFRSNLQKIAYTDSLTKLSNRLAFSEALQNAIGHDTRCALLVLDLDRFKSINDNLGHPAGDVVLTEIARRMVQSVTNTGSVFRLSGDEFAILLDSFEDKSELVQLAETIRQQINQRLQVNDTELFLNASIGIAIAPDDTLEAQELYRYADLALYEAKTQHGSGYHFFTPSIWERSESALNLKP